MHFPVINQPSTYSQLPYQGTQDTRENVYCTRRKWITVALVCGAVVAVALITFGRGHNIVGSVFLSAVPVIFGSYCLLQKYKPDWRTCLGCLRRIFCCLEATSPVLPAQV